MSDNNEKILPVIRWLLAAFLGLLLMLALQLLFVVSGANAATADIYLALSQVISGHAVAEHFC
jgi:hypothetical protein